MPGVAGEDFPHFAVSIILADLSKNYSIIQDAIQGWYLTKSDVPSIQLHSIK